MANTHSINLNGTSQYLNTTTVWVASATNVTLEAWIKTSDYTQSEQTIFSSKDNSSEGYSLMINGAGKTDGTISILDHNVKWVHTTSKITVNDTWIHIALVLDASGNARVVRDGISVYGPDSNTYRVPNEKSAVGSEFGAFRMFNGKIDDVRIWNVARTVTEINNNKDAELTGSESGLVAYYKLNNNLTDTAGSNNLTNNGSATFSTDVPFTGPTELYTRDFTETMPISDSITNDISKSLSEVITMVEIVSKKLTRGFSEAISLIETLATQKIIPRTFNEIININDTIVKIASKTYFETITLVESVKKSINLTIEETITLVESVKKSINRSLLETITIVDNIITTAEKQISEAMTLTLIIETKKKVYKALSEVASLVESFVKKPQKVLTETITLKTFFQGLKNGISILLSNKYSDKARTFINKYRPF